jgi:hypothetical protein
MTLILAIFKVISFTHFLLAFNGVMVSWIYLRFFEKQESGHRGDMSVEFSFATFFPELLHPIVSSLGDFVFKILVRLKICGSYSKTYEINSGPSNIRISLPGVNPIDSERRKQKALKALDERLNKTINAQEITWPSMVSDDNAVASNSDGDENSLVINSTTSTTAVDHLPEIVLITPSNTTDNNNLPD